MSAAPASRLAMVGQSSPGEGIRIMFFEKQPHAKPALIDDPCGAKTVRWQRRARTEARRFAFSRVRLYPTRGERQSAIGADVI